MSMELDRGAERTLTQLDHARLTRLTRSRAGPLRHSDDDPLEHALETATLVASTTIPADVVTMRSRVVLRDLETSRRYPLTLCYPDEAEPADGCVSVLAPVGASLLGLRVGAEARWTRPGGGQGAARLEAILFQPESSGELTR
jgi:regulator of nucleoside diphosphate kinase